LQEFQQAFDAFLATNLEQLRAVAAQHSGSLPENMLLSMAAILLSNGTQGQGPHLDQYKSKKAVQLIVRELSNGGHLSLASYLRCGR
jgi:hypothetical protein